MNRKNLRKNIDNHDPYGTGGVEGLQIGGIGFGANGLTNKIEA